MKTKYISIVIFFISIITPTTSYAKTKINGLYYDLNTQDLEATVIPKSTSYVIDCYTESSIIIPEEVQYKGKTYKVTAIGPNSFSDCENLTSITIPQTVKFIGLSAFAFCTKLKSITLPSGITRIETGTFNNCHSLKTIVIPEGVTTISQSAFKQCSSLESITLPNSLKFISPSAFEESTAIKSVIVKSPTPIAIYKNTFNVFGNLYVPKGSKEAYEKAAIWQDFNIIEDETTSIEDLQATLDSQPSPIFTLSGQRISTPRKGLVIIKGKKVVVK